MATPQDTEVLARLVRLRLDAADFEESFARSSGPGGQHVNKTSTAATLRHVPSGVAVTVQETRSQLRNRALAWERLLDRIESDRRTAKAVIRQEHEKERRQKRKRPRGVQKRILETKRRRGETKKLRGKIREC